MNASATSIPRPFVALMAVLVAGFLFALFAQLTPSIGENSYSAEKVNLALRRTAHHLLTEAGDRTSQIPPVQQPKPGTFLIQLGRTFTYNRLPVLLDQSLKLHGIKGNYDVAVLDCQKGNLLLGYNFRDLTTDEPVPCVGRQQTSTCYTVQLTLLKTEAPTQPVATWGLFAFGFLLAGLLFTAWRRTTPTPQVHVVNSPTPSKPEHQPIRFGNSSFDLANQTLTLGAARHELTYREAKLLHLFVRHLNQLLERDFILKSVWEDEGIIVGRSVDVFVSRLRKLLQDDPAVRIVAVHGVGYRFEVRQPE
ncbi:winged helix-turn-helix domain-containing protein [Spirosoma fluminis]